MRYSILLNVCGISRGDLSPAMAHYRLLTTVIIHERRHENKLIGETRTVI